MKKSIIEPKIQVDWSSPKMLGEIKKVKERQKKIRDSGKPPTLEQMRKITFTI